MTLWCREHVSRRASVVKLLVLLLLVLFVLPTEAIAQDEESYRSVGSAGSLVGATLETAGLYFQSFFLDSFNPLFDGALGALIYTLGAIVVLVLFVMLGKYQFGLWFFLGPTLFFSAVVPRTFTTGSDWIFGAEHRSSAIPLAQAKRTVAEDHGGDVEDYDIYVSSLFAWYDNLISTSVRSIAAVINSDRTKADLNFLLRAELFSQLKARSIEEPGFREFVHLGMLGRCRAAMEAGVAWRELEPPNFDEERGFDLTWPPEWRQLPPVSDEILCKNDYLPEPLDYNDRRCILKGKYRDALISKVPLSEDGWKYLAALSINYGDDLFNQSINNPLDIRLMMERIKNTDQANTDITAADPALSQVIAARGQAIKAQNGGGLTCLQVWNFTYVGLYRYAMRAVEGNLDKGEAAGLDRAELLEQWQLISDSLNDSSEDDAIPWRLYSVIAQALLRNERGVSATSAFIARYAESGAQFSTVQIAGRNDMAATERGRLKNREYAEKTELMNTAASLPYYQGLVLYFLSVAYPFFALLLLLPDKHAGFLLWFSLWLWAKSWDVGFAIVMLLDDMLFSLMVSNNYDNTPAKTDFRPLPDMNMLDRDLATSIYLLREADPTFHLATYYSIIGIALQSIPLVSSYLLIGSLRGGAGLISAGIKSWSTRLGEAAQDYTGQGIVNEQRGQLYGKQMQALRSGFKSADSGGSSNTREMPISGGYGLSGNTLRSERWNPNPLSNRAGGFKAMRTAQIAEAYAAGFGRGWSNSGNKARAGTILQKVQGIAVGEATRVSTKDEAKRLKENSKLPKALKGRGGVLNRGVRVASTILEEASQYTKTMREVELDRELEYIVFDHTNSDYGQRLAAQARILGNMFEIPWTMEEEGGYVQEVDKDIKRMEGLARFWANGVSGGIRSGF